MQLLLLSAEDPAGQNGNSSDHFDPPGLALERISAVGPLPAGWPTVPLVAGEKVIGFLSARSCFSDGNRETLRSARRSSSRRLASLVPYNAVLTRSPYREEPKQNLHALQLLGIFAGYLGLMAYRLILQLSPADPPFMRNARKFIADHSQENVTLTDVARAVHVSVFYLCKAFKRYTNFTFTEYLSRLRIERVTSLLLNPAFRITEAAYAAGFQTITHFNRIFRRLLGQSPSEYRRSAQTSHEPLVSRRGARVGSSRGNRRMAMVPDAEREAVIFVR